MISDLPNPSLTEGLSGAGLRPTRQRELVYEVVLGKRDHPTAEEVFDRVKALRPTISLATVYNCLDALVQCGLIKQVNFVREPTRYCPNLHEHAHFHDETTQEIHDIEIPRELMDRLRAILPPGYKAVAIDLSFRGIARPADAAQRDRAPDGLSTTYSASNPP